MNTRRAPQLHFAGIRNCARLVVALALCAGLSALAQNSGPALSAADFAEIMTLYAKYPMALDSGDAEGYANLFTEDGAFGDRVVGRRRSARSAELIYAPSGCKPGANRVSKAWAKLQADQPATLHYAGPQSQYPGLDQYNLEVPPSLAGRGEVSVTVSVGGMRTNPVWVRIE